MRKVQTGTPIECYLDFQDLDDAGAQRYSFTVITDWNKPDVQVLVFKERSGNYLIRWLDPDQEYSSTDELEVYEGSKEGMFQKFPWLRQFLIEVD